MEGSALSPAPRKHSFVLRKTILPLAVVWVLSIIGGLFLVAYTEVNNLKKMEEAILENIGDAVVAVDMEGKIMFFNKATPSINTRENPFLRRTSPVEERRPG